MVTTEKKTNNNTVRVNEVKHILKVTPQFLRANENNTSKRFTHDTDTKYSSKVDRHKDHNKRQEKAKYYLPGFLRENGKTIIQDRSTILNSVASGSEDVYLPYKRYCSKQILHHYQLCIDDYI